MFINEVEHIVGLTKKSIRYYEENGLINPKRNKENGYRVYEENNYKKIKNMCDDIIRNNESYNNIKIDNYFCDMAILNKEGFTMRDVKTDKKRKIVGSIVSSLVFILFFSFFIWLFSYFQTIEEEQMPWALYWFMVILFGLPIIGIICNLIVRIKEINGGEEDEASKY